MLETIEEKLKTDADYQQVIRALVSRTSMPFLELVALTPVREAKVEEIVDDLERREFVTIYRKDDPMREIVTVTPRRYDHLLRELYV